MTSLKNMICPVMDHIYVIPKEEDFTPGGLALPQMDNEEARTRRGFVFAFSKAAYRMIEESIGPERVASRFHEGAEIEYFGHSTTKIDGTEFHVIRPRDVWAIIRTKECTES